MYTTKIVRFVAGAATVTMLLGISACSNMDRQQRNTAIGAGVGGVAGSVLTDGSTIGTVGGAVGGGLLGSKVK